MSLARSSSLAACNAASASALSPLARLPAPFFDMVRLDGQENAQGQLLRLGQGVRAKLLAGVTPLHLLAHLEEKHTPSEQVVYGRLYSSPSVMRLQPRTQGLGAGVGAQPAPHPLSSQS